MICLQLAAITACGTVWVSTVEYFRFVIPYATSWSKPLWNIKSKICSQLAISSWVLWINLFFGTWIPSEIRYKEPASSTFLYEQWKWSISVGFENCCETIEKATIFPKLSLESLILFMVFKFSSMVSSRKLSSSERMSRRCEDWPGTTASANFVLRTVLAFLKLFFMLLIKLSITHLDLSFLLSIIQDLMRFLTHFELY